MIVHGTLVCNSLLISVCMFIVSKALLISSATVIVRAGGAIWLNPFGTVLFSVCSGGTVECCVLYPFAWVCLVCLLLYNEEGYSHVSLQLLRRGIWVCLPVSLSTCLSVYLSLCLPVSLSTRLSVSLFTCLVCLPVSIRPSIRLCSGYLETYKVVSWKCLIHTTVFYVIVRSLGILRIHSFRWLSFF